jgi:hypothetical protein
MRLANLFGTTEANTGIWFYRANSVGSDVSTGHAVITTTNRRGAGPRGECQTWHAIQ